MLNNDGKVFLRTTQGGTLVHYDPWHTPFLYGL
jgi:hypothetical protein